MNSFDAHGLASDLLASETVAATAGEHDGFVVEGIVDVWQSSVAAGRGPIDLSGTLSCPELRVGC